MWVSLLVDKFSVKRGLIPPVPKSLTGARAEFWSTQDIRTHTGTNQRFIWPINLSVASARTNTWRCVPEQDKYPMRLFQYPRICIPGTPKKCDFSVFSKWQWIYLPWAYLESSKFSASRTSCGYTWFEQVACLLWCFSYSLCSYFLLKKPKTTTKKGLGNQSHYCAIHGTHASPQVPATSPLGWSALTNLIVPSP